MLTVAYAPEANTESDFNLDHIREMRAKRAAGQSLASGVASTNNAAWDAAGDDASEISTLIISSMKDSTRAAIAAARSNRTVYPTL